MKISQFIEQLQNLLDKEGEYFEVLVPTVTGRDGFTFDIRLAVIYNPYYQDGEFKRMYKHLEIKGW